MRFSVRFLTLAGAVLAVSLSGRLAAQIATPTFVLDDGGSASAAAVQAGSGVASVSPLASLDSNPLSYRLDVWGDLFTPEEQTAVRTSSTLLGTLRVLNRAETFSPAEREDRMDRGSAAGTAASWALFFGGPDEMPGALPGNWSQPGNSIGTLLMQRSIFLGADFAERSRAQGAARQANAAALWFTRAIALLPAPHGAMAWQAGMAGTRILTLSVVTGDWPDFGRMSAADWSKFCESWGKRLLAASVAAEMTRLSAPRIIAARDGREIGRSGVPVTLFHENF